MQGRLLLGAAMMLGLAVGGCHKVDHGPSGDAVSKAAEGSTPHSSRPEGVAWFEGDIPQAFAAAAEQHRPVFVYFGAVWCPPCQQLKATVFKRRDFLEKLSLFVPVYLDGDAPRAQRWAAEFRIVGYPTALILGPDHSELERVSGGMDLARYAEVLDLGLSATRPIDDVLALGTARASIDLDDCRRLAYNGWPLEEQWIFSDQYPGWLEKTSTALSQVASQCPANAATERARLIVTALNAQLKAESAALKKGQPPSDRLAVELGQVDQILANQPLALSAADEFECLDGQYFKLSVARTPAATVEPRWDQLMDRVRDDSRFSAADRLVSVACKIEAAKALQPSGKVPTALVEEAHQRVDAALGQNTDAYTRTSLVNAALNVLESLDDDQARYALLSAEIKTSKTPYYYMSDLAQIEEARGHNESALGWYARAYDESQGEATRFQWGVLYIRGLLRLRPTDDAAIIAAVHRVLGELDGTDRLYGRSESRMIVLAKSLHEWNGDGQHAAAIQAVRTQVEGICAKVPPGDQAVKTCASFAKTI